MKGKGVLADRLVNPHQNPPKRSVKGKNESRDAESCIALVRETISEIIAEQY